MDSGLAQPLHAEKQDLKAGILGGLFESGAGRRIVLEIGAGWGGLAYHLKSLCPNVTYIIIDLPQCLLFSALYLRTLFEHASIVRYGDKPLTELLVDSVKYDFVFLPHYCLGDFNPPRIDLTINIASFQEMTTKQVSDYVKKASDLSCRHIYSLNRDCSAHNRQLSSVSAIISKYYRVREVEVLDVPYTDFLPKKRNKFSYKKKYRDFKQTLIECVFKNAYRNKDCHEMKYLPYRHIVGELVGE